MMIGTKIRQLRQDNGLTLEELSKKSGIALATLSRIENEKMIGTLDSHLKISNALGITLSRLFAGLDAEESFVEVQKADSRSDIIYRSNKSASEILTSKVSDKKMLPMMLRIQTDGITEKESGKVGSEKFVYVLSGNIEISIDNDKYKLNTGDTLYFNASLPHLYRNIGNSEAQCLVVANPATL